MTSLLYIGLGLAVLYLGTVFVVALIRTIKEMRALRNAPAPVGFNAGLGFGGELGIKLIKKGES